MIYIIVTLTYIILGIAVWLIYTKGKSIASKGFLWNLIMTISVACFSTLIAIYYNNKVSEASIENYHDVLYPNDFFVGLQIAGSESGEFIPPTYFAKKQILGSEHRVPIKKIHVLETKTNKMKINPRIHNRSSYDAYRVPATLHWQKDAFEEGIEEIANDIKGTMINSLYYTSEYPLGDEYSYKAKLAGVGFNVNFIEAGDHINLGFINLTLQKDSGIMMIRIRENIFVFLIGREGIKEKISTYTQNKVIDLTRFLSGEGPIRF